MSIVYIYMHRRYDDECDEGYDEQVCKKDDNEGMTKTEAKGYDDKV